MASDVTAVPLADEPAAVRDSHPAAFPWSLAAFLVFLGIVGVAYFAYLQLARPQQVPMVAWRIILGSLSNTTCALLGCFLILRRMGLLVDAISHAVLPGIVIVFLFTHTFDSGWMMLGAAAVGLLTTMLTQSLSSTGEVGEDSSMGIVYASLFAVGVLLISYFAYKTHIDTDCVLFGTLDIATIDIGWKNWKQWPPSFLRLAIVLSGAAAFLFAFWKELKIVSFDQALARAMGMPVMIVHYGLMAMVAVASVASFEVVGSVMVVTMFIVPPAAASLLTDRLGTMLVWAAALAIGCSLIGDVLGSVFNVPLSGIMSVIAGVQLAGAIFFASRGGLVARWWRNFQLSLRIQREDVLATLYRREELTAKNDEGRPLPELARGWLPALARTQLRWRKMLHTNSAGEPEMTALGRDEARKIVRSHRLWETYLQKHFDLPSDHLHEPAERMEHFIDERLQAELSAELGDETHDPHGRAIPKKEYRFDGPESK